MRFFAKIILFIFVIIYVVCTSDTLMRLSMDARWRKPELLPYRYKYGDLYGITNLRPYKTPRPKYIVPRPSCDTIAAPADSLALYVLGDSYLQHKRIDTGMCHLAYYQYIPWNDQMMTGRSMASIPVSYINLDARRKNVLIIECVERYVRTRLTTPELTRMKKGEPLNQTQEYLASYSFDKAAWQAGLKNAFSNPNINKNLELNLFENGLFAPFKELKAYINWNIFHRMESKVTISRDNTRLFLSETIETKGKISPFAPISEASLDSLVNGINAVRAHYLDMGFDEVYLAVIPNPVTILDPTWHTYNGFIPRLEGHPRLATPVVSVYSLYQQHPQGVFLRDDTHWTPHGMNLWLEQMKKTVK